MFVSKQMPIPIKNQLLDCFAETDTEDSKAQNRRSWVSLDHSLPMQQGEQAPQ